MPPTTAPLTGRLGARDFYPLQAPAAYDTRLDDQAGSRDGWIGALLLFGLIFGPTTAPGALLPPIRSVDFYILLLLAIRWGRAVREHGGLIFSRRLRGLTGHLLALSAILVFSTVAAASYGLYALGPKDLYVPLNVVRMLVIAGLTASLRFEKRQVRQFAVGLLVIGGLSGALALVQRFTPYYVSNIINSLYHVDWAALETTGGVERARASGTLANANVFAGSLVFLAGSILAVAINTRGFLLRSSAVMVFAFLVIAVIVGSASRTGFIGLLIITVLTLLLSLRGRAKYSSLLVLLLLLGFYLFIQANLESLRLNPRMQVVVGGGAARSLTETLSDRYWFWQRSFEAGMSSPIIGVGASKSVYQLSDNGYLMMFQRAGLVGLTIYLLMIGRLCWRGAKALYVKQESEPRAILLMAFVALVNHVIFEITGDFFWNIAYGGIIAVYLGLLCAASDDVLRNTGLAWSVR